MLVGEKVKLRPLEPEDIDILYVWENDYESWRISSVIEPFSRYTLSKYIEAASEGLHALKQLRLMIVGVEDESPIGCIDLFEFDPKHKRAGIGILIGEENKRKKGNAGEALSIFIKYAFETLGLHQLYCTITENNMDSIALFENARFERVGLRKDWMLVDSDWVNAIEFQLLNTLE